MFFARLRVSMFKNMYSIIFLGVSMAHVSIDAAQQQEGNGTLDFLTHALRLINAVRQVSDQWGAQRHTYAAPAAAEALQGQQEPWKIQEIGWEGDRIVAVYANGSRRILSADEVAQIGRRLGGEGYASVPPAAAVLPVAFPPEAALPAEAPHMVSQAPVPQSAQHAAALAAAPVVLQEQVKKLQAERLCCVCIDNPKNVLFEPCGHLCCCRECYRQLPPQPPQQPKCPICRQSITRVVRVFHS
jgi:hypothetical protein